MPVDNQLEFADVFRRLDRKIGRRQSSTRLTRLLGGVGAGLQYAQTLVAAIVRRILRRGELVERVALDCGRPVAGAVEDVDVFCRRAVRTRLLVTHERRVVHEVSRISLASVRKLFHAARVGQWRPLAITATVRTCRCLRT